MHFEITLLGMKKPTVNINNRDNVIKYSLTSTGCLAPESKF